jgi:hypothetical protein
MEKKKTLLELLAEELDFGFEISEDPLDLEDMDISYEDEDEF